MPYPSRTPHIHFAVSGAGLERMTTQMYLAGEPMNERDFVFRRIKDPRARQTTHNECDHWHSQSRTESYSQRTCSGQPCAPSPILNIDGDGVLSEADLALLEELITG